MTGPRTDTDRSVPVARSSAPTSSRLRTGPISALLISGMPGAIGVHDSRAVSTRRQACSAVRAIAGSRVGREPGGLGCYRASPRNRLACPVSLTYGSDMTTRAASRWPRRPAHPRSGRTGADARRRGPRSRYGRHRRSRPCARLPVCQLAFRRVSSSVGDARRRNRDLGLWPRTQPSRQRPTARPTCR